MMKSVIAKAGKAKRALPMMKRVFLKFLRILQKRLLTKIAIGDRIVFVRGSGKTPPKEGRKNGKENRQTPPLLSGIGY